MRGRFAPSPTGPLHIGSLTTAVASFLHARRAGGEWLVRMEDIDPPREAPGAAADILRTLEALDLVWDGPVLYQSTRREEYAEVAHRLLEHGLAFPCSCTRKDLRAFGGRYPGTCRARSTHSRRTALRVRVEPEAARASSTLDDGLQGRMHFDLHGETGDYVIWRRDGLPAYHLAVVVDDAAQQMTHVVRGSDLLDSTAVHLHLQRLLALPAPQYLHLPVITDARGEKLSKQTGAQRVAVGSAAARSAAARAVLRYLGAAPPADLAGASPAVQWEWAAQHWRIETLRSLRTMSLHEAE